MNNFRWTYFAALVRSSVVGVILAVSTDHSAAQAPTLPMNDDNFLRMPLVGDHSLRLLSSNIVEVMMVTAKDPDPAPLTSWNFLDATGNGTLPAASSFTVAANGSAIPVTAVGFKRRVLYAPLRVRDLRIANWLYLQLGSPIPAGAVVNVQNPGNVLWSSSVIFSATNAAQRYSPSIHVNQAGYISNQAKKAMVGQYLGSLGEMPIPSEAGFQLVNAVSGVTAFTGTLTRRPDVGYSYSPLPYQQVFEADFTSFTTPGEYKLLVPGLGVSFPFYIDDGMAGTYARTYTLGIYHQRCGTDNSLPYTRHTHLPCHTNLVMVPWQPSPEQTFVNYVLNNESAGAASNPRHTAPRMVNTDASLYPFVNTAPFDARGGHHDAGDYSKYTTSVSLFIHNLIFAVDSLPGVKDLDNLGIPESGDGISDVMQEVKWEADYLAKLQDADGGFYFIVYPRTRQYELDSLPDQADLQLVLPKNTSATAAAVGALADMASSPTFKATYPAAASNYLAKAVKGWQFLQNAIARYGKDGAYQMVTFSSDTFMHDDELAWAAAALYVATGDPQYNTALRSYMPNPNSPSLRRWDWWSMFGGWGCATRDYGFAVRSGKLTSAQVDPAYLALCEAEIKFAGSNSVDWSAKMAYGSSFTDESKGLRVAGWYFSGEWTLDPAAAWVVDTSATTKPLYIDCILKNYNYEMGCNPVNVTYLTGLGTKRQREIVHQYALNDRRVLPPAGIPLGNIQAQYDYLQLYKTELSAISYPLDDSPGQPYAYYDRWADTFNVSTEFVVSQTAKTLPAAAMMMAMSSVKTQVWNSATAQIVNLPASSVSTQPVTPSITSTVDLSKARILWESGNNIARQEPFIGPAYNFTPGNAGVQWVEAEAQLPDGRRILAVTNFTAIMPVTNIVELYQSIPLAQNTNVVAWYKLDGSYTDAMAHEGSLTPSGNAYFDNSSFAWASRPNGAALRVLDLGDKVTVNLPNSHLSSGAGTSALSIEAMLYVNRQVAYGRGNANLLTLTKTWNAEIALRHNIWTAGPALTGGSTVIADNVLLANYLKTGQWQHFKVRLDGAGYTLSIDGQTVATVASADLANWGGSGNAALEIGSFDGWIDEVVVKNEGGSVVVSNPPPPVSGTAMVSVSATANAAEAGLVAGSFQISRDSSATTNLTVNFTVGGTATSGADYIALPATVTIPAGSTTTTLTVTPLQDTIFEGNETVVVNLAANAAYSLGTASATVTILDDDPDSRPPPPGQTNYISTLTALNTNVVALYHFDGNLADASGRQPNLTLGGLAVLDAANLNWMSSPSGSGLRVLDLGDNATVTLNNVNLYTAGVTESLGVEAFVFVKAFTAYTHKSATLFKLARRWDAQMIYNQDTWQTTPELWGGVTKVIDVATLAPYLQTNCWQKIGVFLDESGYFIKVNDVEVARTASTDITKWGGAGNVDVEVGSFDGWVDELAVRSNLKGFVPPATTNSQTITFGALANKTFGDAPYALSATASSGLPVTFSSGNTAVATVSGNTLTIVGAGSVFITASQAGNGSYTAAPSVTQTLIVNKAAATVSLSGLSATYDGTAKSVSATTTPSGLPVTITYNGGSSAPVNAGSYAVVATVNHPNYSGSASGTLTIGAATQAITFSALANKAFGDAPSALSATASSGLPVTFSSGNSAVATVSGNTLTVVGVGSVFITASQAGNGNYGAATSVTQTLIVNKATATVSLSGLSATYDGTAKSVSATTTPSGLPVTLTYNGSSSAPSAAGSYAVVATINSANYSGSATGTLTIGAVSQTITFGTLANKTFGDAPYSLSATASSGLPVTFSSGNTAVATVSGNTLTIVGAGSVFITASQAGNGNYGAAASVTQTLIVNKATATVSLSGLSATYDGTAKSVSATTTPSGLPVTITYNGGSSAPVNAGSHAVVATVNHPNYSGSAIGTLTIGAASQSITFGALANKTFGAAAYVLSATASSGLPVTFSSGNTAVATVSGNTVTIVGAGSVFITASQAGNGNYAAATSVTQTLIVNPATATVSLSGLSATYDGSAKTVTATTTPSGLPVTLTYNGSSSAPSAVGSYSVVATVNQPNYSGTANGTLVINKATAVVTLSGLNAVYDGTPKSVGVSTTPAGLSVNVTYNGSASVPANTGSYAVLATVNDASYAGNASGTLLITQPTNQTQTISFAALATKTYGDAAFSLSATASSGLPVSFGSGNTSVATVSGNTVTIVGAGTVVITATQGGDATFNPATPVAQTLTVGKAAATVSLGGLSTTYSGSAKSATATTTPGGLPVTITYDGSSSAPINVGSYAVSAAINSPNYTGSTLATLTIGAASQTISFGALANKKFGDAPSALSATASSGLPVSFSSGNTAVATVSGNTLTVVGVGSVFITASQAGNGNYAAATSVTRTLIVDMATATINLAGLNAAYDGTAKSVTVTTTPSGLPVAVTYNGSNSAPVNVGNYTVVATVNHPNYSGTNSATLTISQPNQTITFAALPAKTYGDAAFKLDATASSGLPVTFSSGNPSVATISGNTVTVVGAGSAIITASQTGNSNFSAAADVLQTLVVNKATATVSLSALSATFDGSAKSVSATTTPGGLPVTITYNGSTSVPVNAGSYAVVVSINHSNYTGSVSGTLTIAAASQTISFSSLPNKTFGDAPYALGATASSGLPVTFASGNTAVATVSGNTLTIVGAGSVFITASQAGNGNYAAATSVTRTLIVDKATATVSLSGLNATYDGNAKNVTITTSPSGMPMLVTYNGSSSAPSAVGSYTVVATVNHMFYNGAASGTLVIADAAAPAILTVVTEGQGTVSPDLNGQTFTSGTNLSLTATPSAGWRLDTWLVDDAATSTNATLDLTMNSSLTVTARFVDASAPSVAITSLATNAARGTAPTMTLSGTAFDNAGVASVEFAVLSGGVLSDYQTAYGTTNWTCNLPEPAYGTNIIRVRARDLQGNLSPVVSRTFNYVVLSPFSLSIVGSGSVTPNLNGQQLELGRTYTLTSAASRGNAFDRWDGGILASNRTLSFVMTDNLLLKAIFRETNAPLVSISLPVSGARFTNSLGNFTGKASDASGLDRVEYSLNGGSFQTAAGTTNWTAPANFVAGTNVFRVRSVDKAGNVSALATRSVFYAVTSPLQLGIAGQGAVAGATNGQRLEIGRAYKVTATPAAGQLFLEWSGGIASEVSALTFLMQPNLQLQANFVTNPFTVLKGNYQALFFESNEIHHSRSGLIKLTVGAAGSYSGSLKLGMRSLALTGAFNARGRSQLNVPLATGNVVAFNLLLDTTNLTESLVGNVNGTDWSAGLSGYRTPVYTLGSAPVTTGRFTFVIPADASSTNNPAGLGFGTLTVSTNGLGTLGGTLGDGTVFSVAAPLSRNGYFPLYAQLYSSGGSALSWLRFANKEMSDFDGALSWIKPVTGVTTAYPAGFTVESFCVGSIYNSTNTPLLSLTNAPMAFTGGALGAGFQNNVTLQPSGALLNLSTNKLSFTLTKTTGLFTGTVMNPGTSASVSYRGALLQKWNAALGHAVSGKKTSALKLAVAE